MKPISNADYAAVIRLLTHLSQRKGNSVRENEDARKARLLVKKLKKNEGRIYQAVPIPGGLGVD